MSRRAHNVGQSTQVTAHSLAILGEHTHTLDSVPLDLSRSFADLRELDAVLSSSMTLLAAKITELTVMLENKTESKEKCLWLLAQIAEEATRLKVGGDDKIRVACHAADTLRAHNSHMKELMNAIPDRDFDNIEPLGRRTIFPHVATRSYMPLGGSGEGGRRQRRAAHSSLLTSSAVDASPNKRKRVTGRDDEAEVVAKTPRKDRQGEPSRQRVTARNRRPERATSPAESLVSVASHMPPAPQATGNPPNSRASIKRSRAAHNANTPGHNTMDPSPHIFDLWSPPEAHRYHLPLWYQERCDHKRDRPSDNCRYYVTLSFLDIPDLASLSHVHPVLAQYAEDPVLHRFRLQVVAPSRVSHSLFRQSSAGVPLRPTVPDLVHRGIIRGLGIERRWRAGMYFHSQHMVTQYENSLRLQRTHAGNVIESTLRRRSTSTLSHVYSERMLPEESASPAISPSLIPTMRKLKWSLQRDRLAKLVKARSDLVRNGGVVTWLEGRGKTVMRKENERVRLALCPGISSIVQFYEGLSR
ncbi:predicted protein [Postia placenta Mad-698-R]|uniref:Inhibitor of growth protein N-terminal histone-binding domain-containing protein n=1 Tax=Postia placenta MAD-698-R-SB12 TaxID=670580 RepID=A0A1X6NEK2_9APHY|nr:hypothetical protein POSPLADRAFT_1063913 [Postia placenta MAD-698-R-SB12]EED80882.1 predicted protein [Postia placenta Mad-698-R]OSX67065.1 hypothetical protein POSPLADRAFT_1063913 [Postia placenta MAD-698-R-SB12]